MMCELKCPSGPFLDGLERAVGRALGPAPTPEESGRNGGRGNKGFTHEKTISPRDKSNFRMMWAWEDGRQN